MKKIQDASEQAVSVIPHGITGVFAASPPDTRSKRQSSRTHILSLNWLMEVFSEIDRDTK